MIWALILAIGVLYVFVTFCFKKQNVCRGGSHPGDVRRRIKDVLDNPDAIAYNLKDEPGPRLSGSFFKFLTWLCYTRFGIYCFMPEGKRGTNLNALDGHYIPEDPTFYPTPQDSKPQKDSSKMNDKLIAQLVEQEKQRSTTEAFRFPTVVDFVKAYKSGKTTPTEVARAVLSAIADSDKVKPPLRAIVQSNQDIVLTLAEASTQRWRDNNPLSLLDGVPVAVKEEFRVEPYEFKVGSVFFPTFTKGVPESTAVRKLLDKGAMIIGVANMHEFGAGVSGSNPNKDHLTARNPYNTQCYPGGSSSGSAVSVAAGFCPVTLGTDAGGSVRIPAALCGVVGLKPTYGLVDPKGELGGDVCVPGPLCSSVLDAAITMNIIAKETDGDKTIFSLEGLGERRLDGLNIGIYWDYFEHAHSEVVSKCRAAVSTLESLGAKIVAIKIPELEENRVALSVSLITDLGNALAVDIDKQWNNISLETLILVAYAPHFSAMEFLNAQKQRTRAVTALKYLFEECKIDAIITPATACTAPKIHPSSLPYGSVEPESLGQLGRFPFLANLTGTPGLVVPVGYSSEGLPIGLQVMGAWYQEHTLLQIGLALEKAGLFTCRKPRVFYDILNNTR